MATAADSFSHFIKLIIPTLRGVEEILAILGLLYVGKVTIATICDAIVGFRAHVFSKLWKKNFVKHYGKWAVVTGCTDGIGKCYSEELAKEGMNIILISRDMEKLKKVSSELVKNYNIVTEVVQIDFCDGQSVYDKIGQHLHDKDIGILVNNVGTMLPYPKYFMDITSDEIWGHVNVNVASVPAMTKLVLPAMVSKGKGAIINIASIAACGPIPLMGVYSASKAFVDNFSQALTWEYKRKGITIQTVNPSYVATKMTSFSPWLSTAGLITPSPSVFAYHAFRTLGYTSRTTGYWIHGIQSWFVEKVLSKWLFVFIMGYTQIFFIRTLKKIHRS